MDQQNKKLILIVEDEEMLTRSLEEKLVAVGFEVMKAKDGREGLKLALIRHPDLILLDLLMPKVDGVAMLKALRQDTWGVYAKVIILTNVGDAKKVAESMDAGVSGTYDYLIKTNWSLEDVILKIKDRLNIKI